MPFVIKLKKKLWGHYTGMSFFIFIFVYIGDRSEYYIEKTIRHEKIHFYQQLELLFVIGWLVWALLMLRSWIKHGKGAYRNHPWEREAYDVDDNLDCVKERKLFAWTKYWNEV